jgi:dCMP deaminase
MIIGLTGSDAAGKDTAANYLVMKGFCYHSLSDLLRNELKKQGRPLTRENLIRIGNEIRTKYGAGELSRRALLAIDKNNEKKSIVVSIRNPEEVLVLKARSGFQMWFVDAPIKLRYERSIKRKRTDDSQSFEDFAALEKVEDSQDPNAQQLKKVAEMADVKIINDSDVFSLHKKIDDLLKNEKR